MKTHGQHNTKLYEVWEHFKGRCLNKKDQSYKDYGARGIKVCDDWLNFIPFYNWATKNGYDEKLTIERIDVNKGYSPDNCKWATRKEQSNNTRVTKIITYNGQSKPLHQWAEELCINPDTLYARVFRNGWSVEKSINTPARKLNTKGIEFNGERKSIAEWARVIGIKKATLWARIKANWPIEKALNFKKYNTDCKFDFQLQRHCGGGSSTTNNNYRPLTADELRLQKQSADYAEHIQPSAYNLYDNAVSGLNNALNPAPDYSGLYNTQRQATAQNSATAGNIANGLLPQQYADNRNAQAKQYAQGAMGDLLNSMNGRGIINSSVTTSGINGINDALANTFQNSYTNDLKTASGLNDTAQNYANMPIQQANQAQQASYQMPLQLFGAATGQMQPTQQIWQPTLMSNQQNPVSSTTSSSGGGLFSGLLGGLGSYVGAGGKF